jgi:hypothetical protein
MNWIRETVHSLEFRNFYLLFAKYYYGYRIQDADIRGMYNTHVGDKCVRIIPWENLKRKCHSDDLGIDGRIILK